MTDSTEKGGYMSDMQIGEITSYDCSFLFFEESYLFHSSHPDFERFS